MINDLRDAGVFAAARASAQSKSVGAGLKVF